MVKIEHTINIEFGEDKTIILTKDEAEELYISLGNSLNRHSSLYYAPNTRNPFSSSPIVAQGTL